MARTKNTSLKADLQKANWEAEYLVKHEKKWVDKELVSLVKSPMVLPVQQAALDKICLDLCNQFKYKSDNWNTFIISPARKVCHKYVTFERYVRNQLTTAMENNHTSQSSGKRTDIQSGVEVDEGHEDQDSVGTFKPYNQSPDPKLSSHPGITRNAPENPADIEAGN